MLERREKFVAEAGFEAAGTALARHLLQVLSELEPESLGLYWPHRSEFNAVTAVTADPAFAKLPMQVRLSLPFARRTPVRMQYHAWNGEPPTLTDECGIPSSAGAPVVPEVVLVPCVGFTAAGYRLGYGGGYFDRWLAANPGVTAVGVAWSVAEMSDADFTPAPHDLPLTLVVTERGVVG